jgi:hypothetical protein
MGFFSKLHEITAWIDPAAHYTVDAIHDSSTKLVGETSHAIGDIFGNSWLGKAGQHWDEMADKDNKDFNRWATNTALSAAAIEGGISAAGAMGGGTAAGAGVGGAEAVGGGGSALGYGAGYITPTVGAGEVGAVAAGGGSALGYGAGYIAPSVGAGGGSVAAGTGAAAAGGSGYLQAGQALLGAGASIYSSNLQAAAARDAANATLAQNQQTRADTAPWRIAGANAVDQLSAGTLPDGYFSHQFNANDLNATLAPNYAFQLDQGQRANQNAAGVAGGLVGGNALKGLQDYTQNYAAGAYQQAYKNYTDNQTNIFNRLSNIAGLGQTANQTTTTAGTQNNALATGYLTSGAAAQAAGIVGGANSVNNGINNYLGWNYLNQGG